MTTNKAIVKQQQYVAKVRKLDTCEFGALKEDLIRDRLVMGTKDSSAQACMLREPNLTLTKAIDMWRSTEQTQIQIKINSQYITHPVRRIQSQATDMPPRNVSQNHVPRKGPNSTM